MEYGMAATATAAKSHTDKIARIQNQAMRLMTGAMRTTATNQLETVTGLQSMEDRRDTKVMTQAAKYKRLESHPMNDRMKMPTKGRLKRSSFIHESRAREERNPELLEYTASPLVQNTAVPAWKRETYPVIRTTIQGVNSKETQSGQASHRITLKTTTQLTCGHTHTLTALPLKPPEMEAVVCTSGTQTAKSLEP